MFPPGINCTRRQECIGLHHVGKSLAGQQMDEVRLGNESKSFNVHGIDKERQGSVKIESLDNPTLSKRQQVVPLTETGRGY